MAKEIASNDADQFNFRKCTNASSKLQLQNTTSS